MNYRILTLMLAVTLAAVSPETSWAGETTRTLETQIRSSDWTARERAFDTIVSELQVSEAQNQAPQLKDANALLIQLLATEAAFVAAHNVNEAYTEYYAALVGEVAERRDPRSIDVLLSDGVLTSGIAVPSALASFGDPFVYRIVARYQTATAPDDRVALLMTLTDMLAMRSIVSADHMRQVKNLVVRSAADSDPMIRIEAVRGLAYFTDGNVRVLLQKIAANDSHAVTINGQTSYPVRSEAKQALNALGAPTEPGPKSTKARN